MRRTRLWQSLRDWRYLRQHEERRQFYRSFVRSGALVYDIGANVGHYALLFDSLGARVIAVEPQANLASEMRRRFAWHRRIKVVRSALGAAPATAVLRKTPGLSEVASLRDDISTRSRFAATHEFSEAETVPITTLDALIAENGVPDFCKIDVEGYESAVLAGLSQALPCLSLEFNREFWPETTHCLDRLRTLGNYRFNYALAETPALARQGWLDAPALVHELQSRSDPLLWGDLYARLA